MTDLVTDTTPSYLENDVLRGHLDWLFARQRFGRKPGLERVRALLGALGNPQTGFETVLVGGTNGKGSTAAALGSMIRAGGRTSAVFTSPHLSHFAERFVIGGRYPSDKVLVKGLEHLRPAAETADATFFEITTALACWLFAEAEVDSAVMEVGLGGRFDSTNALEPSLSIITSISLDHTAILGDTETAIASEKAGIMRPGRRCLTGATDEARVVLREIARAQNAPLWSLGEAITITGEALGWDGIAVDIRSPLGSLTVRSPWLGQHQTRNVALAAVAAQSLGISEEAIGQGAAAARHPGRLERLTVKNNNVKNKNVLLDGAHNPAAALALADALRTLHCGPVTLVFGVSQSKDHAGIVAALKPVVSRVVVTRAEKSPRATPPDELAAFWDEAYVAESLQDALDKALDETPDDGCVVVAGSLFLIGEVRSRWLGEGLEPWERWQ